VKKAVCPGSFDPVTFGHLDVFERAAEQFDHVTVAVLHNGTKSGLFSMEQRIEMITECVKLLADYCKENGISAIFKGLRAVSDFDYELQMAQMNSRLGVDTLFVATNPEYSFLSSSIIKEIAKFGGDVSGLVPENVNTALKAQLSAKS